MADVYADLYESVYGPVHSTVSAVPATVAVSALTPAVDVLSVPVTFDLRFLEDAVAFTRAFDRSFRTTGEFDPMRRVTVVDGEEVVEQERYGYVRQPRPDLPLWKRFFYQPMPLGLLLFKDDHRIKLVANFTDPEYVSADDAIMGGHLFIAPSTCWQVALLQEWGFSVVQAQNLNAPPYIVDEQGEML